MSGATAPFRIVAIGCGRVFERFHLPALSRVSELELVAVCDADVARLEWLRTRLPAVAHAASLDALPASARPDAVLILTPPSSHRAIAERALAAGLHVLVEKPMTLDSASARAMAHAAGAAGRRLQVGYTRRFRAPYRALHQRIRAAPGALEAMSYQLAVPGAAWRARGGFLGVDAEGGGVLDDVLSHQVDLVRWMSGAEPTRVRATALPDGAVRCELELESGVTARCHAAHAAYTEYFEAAVQGGGALGASGARTYARTRPAGDSAPPYARVADRAALAFNRVLRRRGVTPRSFEAQLRDFAAAIGGRACEGAGPDDGVVAVAAVEAARASLADGRWREIG